MQMPILDQQTTYSLVRRMGEGGMGTVYEAIQHGADGFTKRVAIKQLREWVLEKPEFLQNFVGEAKLVAQLIHTNIVQTYQLGISKGSPFIAMEYIHGVDLLQLLSIHTARNKPIPVPLAVFIASRICRGLAYAHQRRDPEGRLLGIVHRDISPQNIMISAEGDVKITDFGMAKAVNYMLDGEGEIIMGKLCYMSPEQAEGGITDARSDLYSTGVVLSELLTGVNVFAAQDSQEVIRRVVDLEVPDFRELCPSVDDKLGIILSKALHKDPNQRYQEASTMLVDLEKYIYSAGYGPTSETLAQYVQSFIPQLSQYKKSGGTALLKGA
jgi:eukaryotic-like serine/threonine-protein kinase